MCWEHPLCCLPSPLALTEHCRCLSKAVPVDAMSSSKGMSADRYDVLSSLGSICNEHSELENIFVSFQSDAEKSEELRWRYALDSLVNSMKALSFGNESCVKINSEGVLCVQHQVKYHLMERSL